MFSQILPLCVLCICLSVCPSVSEVRVIVASVDFFFVLGQLIV
jgi:hypothetical protein